MASDKILGAITYWSVSNVSIRDEALAELFDEVDLDKDSYIIKPQRGSAIFRKALRVGKRKAAADERKRDDRRLIRPIVPEGADQSVYGIFREDVNEDDPALNYKLVARIVYHKVTKSVTVKGKHPLAEAVRKVYDHLTSHHVSSDIRRMLRNNLSNNGDAICLRSTGGVYFAPPHMIGLVHKHQAVIDSLGSEMTVLTISATEANKYSLGCNVKRALQQELAELAAELTAFKIKTPRECTLRSRIAEFGKLQANADMHAALLDIEVNNLQQGISDCKTYLLESLSEVQKTKTAKKQPGKKGTTRKLKRSEAAA